MRDIKFRAWDTVHKIMSPVEYLTEDGVNIYQPIQINDRGDIDWTSDFVKFPTAIPMQYTGLKDKNGKEIYEGDIIRGGLIRYASILTMGEVIYDEYWCSFANRNEAGDTLIREINSIEVIGNIYENQELMSA